MVPLLVFVPVLVVARASGELGIDAFDSWAVAVRVGLASMLLITASAHFGSRRADLIRMVPPVLPRPELLVTVTGIAELVTAFGLLVEEAAPVAGRHREVAEVVAAPARGVDRDPEAVGEARGDARAEIDHHTVEIERQEHGADRTGALRQQTP